MQCPNCGKEIIQTDGKRKKQFCNSTCRSNVWHKERRKNKKPPIKPYPKHLKQALEKSIVTVVNRNDGSMECGANTTVDGLADQISNISWETVHTMQNEK